MNFLHRKIGTPAAFIRALGKHNTTFDNLVPLSASRFPIGELVDVYNQTRSDYVIPMPMSRVSFEKYIELYNIDLDMSIAVMDTVMTEIVAIGLLGVRGGQGWISRLGVTPLARGRGIGHLVSSKLLERARSRGIERLWLELLVGSEIGLKITNKFDFHLERDLIVGRRPPNPTAETKSLDAFPLAAPIEPDELIPLLNRRKVRASWTNQTSSYEKIKDQLAGFTLSHPEHGRGWVIYENNRFQLRRITIEIEEGDEQRMAEELLSVLHQIGARRDASIENLPADSPIWQACEKMGYFETFRRHELFVDF